MENPKGNANADPTIKTTPDPTKPSPTARLSRWQRLRRKATRKKVYIGVVSTVSAAVATDYTMAALGHTQGYLSSLLTRYSIEIVDNHASASQGLRIKNAAISNAWAPLPFRNRVQCLEFAKKWLATTDATNVVVAPDNSDITNFKLGDYDLQTRCIYQTSLPTSFLIVSTIRDNHAKLVELYDSLNREVAREFPPSELTTPSDDKWNGVPIDLMSVRGLMHIPRNAFPVFWQTNKLPKEFDDYAASHHAVKESCYTSSTEDTMRYICTYNLPGAHLQFDFLVSSIQVSHNGEVLGENVAFDLYEVTGDVPVTIHAAAYQYNGKYLWDFERFQEFVFELPLFKAHL